MKVFPPNQDEAMKGWLKKRHSHKSMMGKQWAKRYVVINSKRGTLSVSKGACPTALKPTPTVRGRGHVGSPCARPCSPPGEKGGATTILPLCDVSAVHMLDNNTAFNEWHDFCFEIVAPPQRVQLRAETRSECDQWLSSIRENVDQWHSEERLMFKARMSGAPAMIASQFSAEVLRQQGMANVYGDDDSC